MTAATDALKLAFRDYVTDKVPATGDNEPDKFEIRAAVTQLGAEISAISNGLKRYATKALMNADTDEADGTLAYVYDDATAANNTVYQWDDAGNAWVEAAWYFDAVAEVAEPLIDAAVAAVQMPPAPRVLLLGHSFAQQNHASDGTDQIRSLSIGETAVVQALYPWFEMDPWADPTSPTFMTGMNQGVSGETSIDVIARLPEALRYAPRLTRISIAINDVRAGRTAAATFADVQTIVRAVLAIGSAVIIDTIAPVAVNAEGPGTWGLADPKRTVINDYNTLLRNWVATGIPGLQLFDAFEAYDDGTGVPHADAMYDGLHPSQTGVWKYAAPVLLPLVRNAIPSTVSIIPNGTNKLFNASMSTPGGVAGTGASGIIPSGWTVSNASGGPSDVVGSQSGGKQVLTFDPDAAGTGAEIFYCVQTGRTVTVGTWIRAYAKVTLSAWAGWRKVLLRTSHTNALDYLTFDAAAEMETSETTTLTLVSPPYLLTVGETTTDFNLITVIDSDVAGTGVMTIESVGVVEVSDPRPRHGISS